MKKIALALTGLFFVWLGFEFYSFVAVAFGCANLLAARHWR